jgi:hypothetical protein
MKNHGLHGKPFYACEMPHKNPRNFKGQAKRPIESDENHSQLADYQQCGIHSVDKLFQEIFLVIGKNSMEIN